MTNIDDVVNQKLDKAACAEMAPAKGGEMKDELKPCPFCGSSNLVIENLMDVVYCNDCGAEMTGDAPVGCWNARPIEDALNARIAERDALIERLVEAGSGLVYDCELAWLNNHIPDCAPAVDWRKLVREWQAMKGGEK